MLFGCETVWQRFCRKIRREIDEMNRQLTHSTHFFENYNLDKNIM